MPFDVKKFMKTRFTPREEAVDVPDLKDFFEEQDGPQWKVRGLTGQELAKAKEAAEKNRNITAILEALAGGKTREKADSIKKLLGIADGETPADIARRVEALTIGSIEPVCDLELALKLCETCPIEFYLLTNKITELTGKGHVPGKAPPSGRTEGSGQP